MRLLLQNELNKPLNTRTMKNNKVGTQTNQGISNKIKNQIYKQELKLHEEERFTVFKIWLSFPYVTKTRLERAINQLEAKHVVLHCIVLAYLLLPEFIKYLFYRIIVKEDFCICPSHSITVELGNFSACIYTERWMAWWISDLTLHLQVGLDIFLFTFITDCQSWTEDTIVIYTLLWNKHNNCT